MIIYIKNMVCLRCKIVVHQILTRLGLEAEYIRIGEILLKKSLSNYKMDQLEAALKETGLELFTDNKTLIVQKIKNLIFETIHLSDEPLMIKFSCYLSRKLNYSYTYLSNIFKKSNGISIEQYIILQKIERVKKLLLTDGVYLSEIACQMNYSSVSHLSSQFKKITGIRASDYKLLKMHSNKSIPRLMAV